MTYARASIALLALVILATACGSDDEPTGTDAAPRVVEITMTDNKYDPTEVAVTKGETVTFEFTNEGVVTHEALIGDEAAQEDHAVEMTETRGGMDDGSMPSEPDGATSAPMAGMGETTTGTEHGASLDPNQVVVEPGETGTLVYTFDEAGELIIGCHETGHWEAGMKATITVS